MDLDSLGNLGQYWGNSPVRKNLLVRFRSMINLENSNKPGFEVYSPRKINGRLFIVVPKVPGSTLNKKPSKYIHAFVKSEKSTPEGFNLMDLIERDRTNISTVEEFHELDNEDYEDYGPSDKYYKLAQISICGDSSNLRSCLEISAFREFIVWIREKSRKNKHLWRYFETYLHLSISEKSFSRHLFIRNGSNLVRVGRMGSNEMMKTDMQFQRTKEKEWSDFLDELPIGFLKTQIMKKFKTNGDFLTAEEVNYTNPMAFKLFLKPLYDDIDRIGSHINSKMELWENDVASRSGKSIGVLLKSLLERHISNNGSLGSFLNTLFNIHKKENKELKVVYRFLNLLKDRNPLWNWLDRRKGVLECLRSTTRLQDHYSQRGCGITRGTTNQKYMQADNLLKVTNHNLLIDMTRFPKSHQLGTAHDNCNFYVQKLSKKAKDNANQDSVVIVHKYPRGVNGNHFRLGKGDSSRVDSFSLEKYQMKTEKKKTFLRLWECKTFRDYVGGAGDKSRIFKTDSTIPLPMRKGSSKSYDEIMPFRMSTYRLLETATGLLCRKYLKFCGGDYDYLKYDGYLYGLYRYTKTLSSNELNSLGIEFSDAFTIEDCFAPVMCDRMLPEWKHFQKNLWEKDYPVKRLKGGTTTTRKMTQNFYRDILQALTGRDYIPPDKKMWGWANFENVNECLIDIHIKYGIDKINDFLKGKGVNSDNFDPFKYEGKYDEDGKRYVKFGLLKWWVLFFEHLTPFANSISYKLKFMSSINNKKELEKHVLEFINECIKIATIKDLTSYLKPLLDLRAWLAVMKIQNPDLYYSTIRMFAQLQIIQVEYQHGQNDMILKGKTTLMGNREQKNRLLLSTGIHRESEQMMEAFDGKETVTKFDSKLSSEDSEVYKKIKEIYMDNLEYIFEQETLSIEQEMYAFQEEGSKKYIEIPFFDLEYPDDEPRYLKHIGLIHFISEDWIDLEAMDKLWTSYNCVEPNTKMKKKMEKSLSLLFHFRKNQINQDTCWPSRDVSDYLHEMLEQENDYVDTMELEKPEKVSFFRRNIVFGREKRCVISPRARSQIMKHLIPYYNGVKTFSKVEASKICQIVNEKCGTNFSNKVIYNFKKRNSPGKKRTKGESDNGKFFPDVSRILDFKKRKVE